MLMLSNSSDHCLIRHVTRWKQAASFRHRPWEEIYDVILPASIWMIAGAEAQLIVRARSRRACQRNDIGRGR
jgi:hypothetical protein